MNAAAIALTALLSASAAAPAAAFSPFLAEAESTASVTDITTSGPWWDLCLLFNGGEPKTFNALQSCVSEKRRYEGFQYVCAKPYKADIYVYLYFDSDASGGFSYDASADYRLALSVAREGADGKVEWSESGDRAMARVGEDYAVGSQRLAKFRVAGALKDAAPSSTFDFSVGSFGALRDGAYKPIFGIDAEQEFTYTDDQYDMTARLWGTETTTVSVIAESAKPMTVKRYDGGEWAALISQGMGSGSSGAGSGYYENHFAFFDLDRTPDQIIAVDFYYTMVDFCAEGLYSSHVYAYDGGGSSGDYAKDTPTGVAYVPGNAIEKEYAGTAYATTLTQKAAHCYSLNPDGSAHTVDNVETDVSWAAPFSYSYTRHIPQIVNNAALDVAVGDKSTRDWLRENAVKPDGSLYHYSTCFDSTRREWTAERTRTVTNRLFGWDWGVPLSDDSYRLFRSHTAQGIVVGKMTVAVDGKQLDWNAFSQAVGESPDAPAAPSATGIAFNEMLIALNRKGGGWLVAAAMALYATVCAAVIAALTVLVAGSGAQRMSVRVEAGRRGRKGRR